MSEEAKSLAVEAGVAALVARLPVCPCCGIQQAAQTLEADPAAKIAGLERALETERSIVRGTIHRIEGLRGQIDQLLHELEVWHRQRRAIGTNR